MAAQILSRGLNAPASAARDAKDDACPADDEGLSPGRAMVAAAVAAAAMLLAAAPAAVAVVAIVSPDGLNRTAEWLLGASAAFSLVAAGRVPAAALLAIVLARCRPQP
jgi:anti-sigma factor RsiW